jgi:hypothetical protein
MAQPEELRRSTLPEICGGIGGRSNEAVGRIRRTCGTAQGRALNIRDSLQATRAGER